MKAAVFDIDGTLVDSMGFWDNVSVNYLLSQGIKPKDNLNQTLQSLTVIESIEYMKNEYGISKESSEIKDEINTNLYNFYKKEAKLKPYAVDLIKVLSSKKVRLAVASVTEEKFIEALLKRYGIYNEFEFIQTCSNTKLSKEDTNFYKILSNRLGIEPSHIFLFEDSLYSMETASRVGLKIVGVEDYYSRQDLRGIIEISDIYIKSFKDFVSLAKL